MEREIVLMLDCVDDVLKDTLNASPGSGSYSQRCL